MKTALIIFVRNPVFGKVKSRLAATLGKEKALAIYKELLAHTNKILKDIPVEKFVFYDDFINHDDIWQNETYHKFLQEGDNLGERMKKAFEKLFNDGYTKAVIIGSDCFELTTGIILKGIKMLSTYDIVIGPASDGGYYLLGMNNFIHELFENKKWSTDTVYRDTLDQVEKFDHSVGVLALLNDVDEENDISIILKKTE